MICGENWAVRAGVKDRRGVDGGGPHPNGVEGGKSEVLGRATGTMVVVVVMVVVGLGGDRRRGTDMICLPRGARRGVIARDHHPGTGTGATRRTETCTVDPPGSVGLRPWSHPYFFLWLLKTRHRRHNHGTYIGDLRSRLRTWSSLPSPLSFTHLQGAEGPDQRFLPIDLFVKELPVPLFSPRRRLVAPTPGVAALVSRHPPPPPPPQPRW